MSKHSPVLLPALVATMVPASRVGASGVSLEQQLDEEADRRRRVGDARHDDWQWKARADAKRQRRREKRKREAGA